MNTITITTKTASQMNVFVAMANELKVSYTTTTTKPSRKKKTGLEKAIEEVEKGKTYKVGSVKELMALADE